MELLKVSKDKRALKFIKKRVRFPTHHCLSASVGADIAASSAQPLWVFFHFYLQDLKLLRRFVRVTEESVFSFKSLGSMFTIRQPF